MKIPVFHDDQHGTAIIAAAALLNALRGGRQADRRGQAGLLGRRGRGHRLPEHRGRPGRQARERLGHRQQGRGLRRAAPTAWTRRRPNTRRTPPLARWLRSSTGPTCSSACPPRACSSRRWWRGWRRGRSSWPWPTPSPEIRPELAKEVRPDCIIATGRSDYPNQVNNVLCFPYIFRGALDCGATKITEEMKLACVREIAELARADVTDEVAAAYAGRNSSSVRTT